MARFTARQEQPGTPRAVEVTAIYGDSIMALAHLEAGAKQASPRRTAALSVVAALLLGLGALAFSRGVAAAGTNASAYRTHLAQEKLAHEFRPQRLHGVWEGIGLGGALGGLLLATLTLARRREGKGHGRFRVGQVAGADYPAQLSRTPAFDLVQATADDGFVLRVPKGWSAEVRGPTSLCLAEAGFRTCALEADSEAELRCGDHHFSIRSVRAPRKQSLPFLAGVDTRFLAFLSGSTIAVVGLMLSLATHFETESSLYSELFASSPRLNDYRVHALEKELLRPAITGGPARGPSGGTGTATLGARSAMGSQRSDQSMGRFAIERKRDAPQLARGHVITQAREAGLLGVLRQHEFMATETGIGSFSSGLDEANVYGGLIGNQVGEMSGGWGYGVFGVGTGGGGSGFGSIGTGQYGVIGHGSGTGSGWGSGHAMGASARESRMPGVLVGNATAIGALDKNIIRRYIRRKIPRIRHCYEKALLVAPSLEGTVETVFQISPMGAVKAAQTRGMDNQEMHTCVSDAILSIQFPKPRGGGFVAVTYPFTFAPPQ